MLNCIVFSRNRACQLDAFLRSLKLFWSDWKEYTKINVIYDYSEEKFLTAYKKLFEENTDINFVDQHGKDFKKIMVEQTDPTAPLTVQFVDDIIFINPFTIKCPEFEAFKNEPETTCLSLRVHPLITYCYMMNIASPPPRWEAEGKWAWFSLPGEWGYPYSQDGHIIRTEDVLPCIKEQSYGHPNALEVEMTNFTVKRPYMRCFQKAKIINIPANRVGQFVNNRVGNISVDFLNDQYLKGLRINLKPFCGIQANAVHCELEYSWLKFI
jgi:hypothetical protein